MRLNAERRNEERNEDSMKQLIIYGIVGVITTLIDIIVYWLVSRFMFIPVVPSTIIAWVVAFIFAYWANRIFVFHSHNAVLSEAFYFFICRLSTGILDVLIMYVFADVLAFHDVSVKVISNIIVIVLNYIASKLFIFRGRESK